MELHDALVPFKPKGSGISEGTTTARAALRIAVLTQDQDLLSQIDEALCLLRVAIEPVDRINDVKDRIRLGEVDLTIIHVYHADAWPGIAFHLFDRDLRDHPVVMLCGSVEEARHYRRKSDHVIDILPEEAVRDYRFRFLIQGAMLRADALRPAAKPDDHTPAA